MGYTIWPDGITGEIVEAVYKERRKQDQLKSEGKFKYTCADVAMGDGGCMSVLSEEVGEVGHEINEFISSGGDEGCEPEERGNYYRRLKKELIQVAAVAVAWAESCDERLSALPDTRQFTSYGREVTPEEKTAIKGAYEECNDCAHWKCIHFLDKDGKKLACGVAGCQCAGFMQ